MNVIEIQVEENQLESQQAFDLGTEKIVEHTLRNEAGRC